jgi:hypothetical protein
VLLQTQMGREQGSLGLCGRGGGRDMTKKQVGGEGSCLGDDSWGWTPGWDGWKNRPNYRLCRHQEDTRLWTVLLALYIL